jgi:hypothetical protein
MVVRDGHGACVQHDVSRDVAIVVRLPSTLLAC